MSDVIEKQIELRAPLSRVWQALTDHRQFGEWFGVKLESPFVAGRETKGIITFKEKPFVLHLVVESIEPETYFSYRWHPYAHDPSVDYSKEVPTLVEFRLEPIETGTLLRVIESGFEKVPANRRAEAFRMNSHGWEIQTKKFENYVAKQS